MAPRKGDGWNWFRGLQVAAMRAVAAAQPEYREKLDADGDYFLRTVFRWYSKTFSTPLHEVADLPLDDVLLHYWESQYEEMEADEREAVIKRLRETDEERRQREAKDSEAVDADEAWLRQVEQEEQERLAKKNAPAAAAPASAKGAKRPTEKDSQLPDYEEKPIEGFSVNFVNDPKEIEDLMKKWDEG